MELKKIDIIKFMMIIINQMSNNLYSFKNFKKIKNLVTLLILIQSTIVLIPSIRRQIIYKTMK